MTESMTWKAWPRARAFALQMYAGDEIPIELRIGYDQAPAIGAALCNHPNVFEDSDALQIICQIADEARKQGLVEEPEPTADIKEG